MRKMHISVIMVLCLLLLAAPAMACSIKIIKDAQPNNAQDFKFTVSNALSTTFYLDDDSDSTLSNSKYFGSVSTGKTYTFTEGSVSGWTLGSISCTKTGTATITKDLPNRKVSITISSGDVTCTFVNTKPTCTPTTEICDGKDNDCDGQVDEGSLICDDGNVCTTDVCKSDGCGGAQCVRTANTNSCDDGNACTVGDICSNKACVSGTPKVCTNGDQCNNPGTCNPSTGVCSDPTPKPDGTNCDDGNLCNGLGTCKSGSCDPGTPVTCPDPGVCKNPGICNPASGVCSDPTNKDDGTNCDDGNLCTTDDECTGGVCGGTQLCPPDDNICDREYCDSVSGLCMSEPVNEGDPCGINKICVNGVCEEQPSGCTYTQGYWKNHEEEWPGSIPPTTDFYDNLCIPDVGSWMGVLETPAGDGPNYYPLAHQFIAAKLNMASGASTPDLVDDALAYGNTFFSANCPVKKTGPAECTAYFTCVLDNYNCGVSEGGPGHCDGYPACEFKECDEPFGGC